MSTPQASTEQEPMNHAQAIALDPRDCQQLFEENGYVVIRRFIPRIMCDYISQNIRVLEANSAFFYNDGQVEKAFSAPAPVVTEMLLDVMTPVLAEAINCELYPTYSYLRIYQQGADLERHQDRPSCEVSATVPLSYDSHYAWPIYVESRNQVKAIELEPGDALVYKGCEVPHWREPFEGERQVQVFLHYVKKHGDYSEYKFDRRPALGHQLVSEDSERWLQLSGAVTT